MADKKIFEGDELMKQADKLVTKTMFRWKSDWDGACGIYEKAGTCYKNAKAYDKAKEAFKKSAIAFNNSGITFSAAKNMELAASMAKEGKNIAEAVDLYEQSSNFYREQSSSEKAAETLEKAAKILEDSDQERSLKLVMDACDIYQDDDKEHYSSQTFKYATALALKFQKYEAVLELLKKRTEVHEKLNQHNDVFKMYLSLIIVNLHIDDYVSADRAYQNAIMYGGFSTAPEARVAQDILDAYEKRNNEALQKSVGGQVITFLDNEIAKLAKGLKIKGGIEGGKQEEEESGGLA